MLVTTPILGTIGIILLIKYGILTLLFLYIIFSLIVLRQVSLMSKSLMTPVGPVVKALAIFNAGFSVAFFILALGSL